MRDIVRIVLLVCAIHSGASAVHAEEDYLLSCVVSGFCVAMYNVLENKGGGEPK